MATIKQIASLAGVSRGTVDRVLNNRGSVNAETALKVREIAEALHYSPNKIGKSLAVRKKNYKIGFILFSNTANNPFFDDVVAGIESKARDLEELGVSVEIHFSEFDNWRHQIELLELLEKNGISGIAVTPCNHPEIAKKIRQLMENDIPVVTVNTDIENSNRLAYVGSNYYKSGRTAGNLMGLIMNGQANVGIVTGSSDILCHSERVSGFKDYIKENFPQIKIVSIVENQDDDFESFSVTKRLLNTHPEIDALYFAAAGVYGAGRAIKSMGLAGKLKIISFDTVPTTRKFVEEGLISITIDQQPHKQGSKPLDILMDYFALGILPKQDCFYTNVEIKVLENMDG